MSWGSRKYLPMPGLLAILLLASLAFGVATISATFENPTPDNATVTTNTSTYINISVSETDTPMDTFIFNWNGTNYSIYDNGLVWMFNLDNQATLGENSTHAVDVSQSGYNMSIIGATWNTSGKYGNALSFIGSAGHYAYYSVVTEDNLDTITSNMTVEVWFQPNKIIADARITAMTTTNLGHVKWGIYLDTNGWISSRRHESDASSILVNSTVQSIVGQWYYAVVMTNTTSSCIYIDGVQKTCAIYDGTQYGTFGHATIGALRWDGTVTGLFNGTIDEVRIYNRSLSADEINRSYYSNLNKYKRGNWTFETNATGYEGNSTYFAFVNDTSGDAYQLGERTIRMGELGPDTTDPTVALISPDDNAWNSTQLVTFRFTPQDDRDIVNATVWHNASGTWAFNNSNTSALSNNTEAGIAVQFSADGTLIWNVNVSDSAGNWHMASANRTVNVDTKIPEGALISPEHAAINNTRLMTFHYNATDEFRIVNATLWTNMSGTWAFNNSNTSAVTNNTDLSITVQFDSDGLIEWNVIVEDAAGNKGHMSVATNQTILVDTTAPTVTVSSPNDNIWNTTQIVTFHYKPDETFDITNATLWTNKSGTWDYNNSNATVVANNSDNSIAVTFDADGSYLWNIYVNDSAGNAGTSSANRTLNIDSADPIITKVVANDTTPVADANVTLTITATEANWNQTFCWHDNGANYSGGAADCSLKLSGSDANYTIHVYMNDSAGNYVESNLAWAVLDIVVPDVVLNSPTDASTNSSSDITFQYFVNDSGSIASAAIYTNASGAWALNRSNITPVTNGTMNEFDLSYLHDGNLSWNVYVCDGSGNCEYAVVGNWSVNVQTDIEAPRYNASQAKSPSGSVETGTFQQFTITVSDNSAVNMVTLQYGLSGSEANYTMSNESASAFEANRTAGEVGTYTWKMYMNDTYNNINDTPLVSFGVTSPEGGAGGGGSETRLLVVTEPAEEEASNYTIEDPSPTILIDRGMTFRNKLKITNNQHNVLSLKFIIQCSEDKSCEWFDFIKYETSEQVKEFFVQSITAAISPGQTGEANYRITVPDVEDGDYKFSILVEDIDTDEVTEVPVTVKVGQNALAGIFGFLDLAFEFPKPCARYENQTVNGSVEEVCVARYRVEARHIIVAISLIVGLAVAYQFLSWGARRRKSNSPQGTYY